MGSVKTSHYWCNNRRGAFPISCKPFVKVVGGKKKTGRYGMELWHILVLSTVRMGLDANYDRLEDFANHHSLIRQTMGVETGCGAQEPGHDRGCNRGRPFGLERVAHKQYARCFFL